MQPRRFTTDAVKVQAMALQLSTKEIFRTVLAVSAGENQGFKGWVQGKLRDDVTQLDILHTKVGGIRLIPET